ncbi:MAG: NUDIX domain-containing protein [bacterium]|nr:NUDIX domain-containing protein [bacterium]
MPPSSITVYVQSKADNSPGHAGIGLIITGSLTQEISEYIGIASAVQAMYQAVIQAFSFAADHEITTVCLCSDSAELLKRLQQRHCPDLSIDLSSLHKRAVQSARYHRTEYRLLPSSNPYLLRASQLAAQAISDQHQPQTSASDHHDKHHALQQSAGGVVYKRQGQHIKVCLIAKKDGQLWALPKGRLQPGESWEGTAVREVLEETGHLATIADYIDQIDYYFYWKDNHTLYYKLVAFFLMPVIVENHRQPDGEADKIAWFALGDALQRLHYQSEKNILYQAQKMLKTVY